MVRAPGLADDLLQQLAPLLAESGIDLTTGSHTIEEVNAALAAATERHNLILTTPVGKSLTATFETIAIAVDQISYGDIDAFIEEASSLHPDEEPTPAQVIGVCLGRLDDWYTNPETSEKLAEIDLSKWQAEDRQTVAAILELARQGRAFASYRELLLEHGGGERVLLTSLVAVAQSLFAWCEHDGVELDDLVDELFPE
ncbi:hypothetical protein LSHI6S_00030 [Leifsonia shinshuensis]